MFTGPRLHWPLNAVQLTEMERAGYSGWTLIEENVNEALGHFDLAVDGEAARIERPCANSSVAGLIS